MLFFMLLPDFSSNDIEKLCRGDTDAFERLFRTYSRGLIHFCLRYVNDLHIAENCVQEVFIHIWEHRSKLDPKQNIKSYLFTAVRNRALKEIRRETVRRNYQPHIILEPIIDPYQKMHAKELESAIAEAIAGLPEKCRQVFEMNRFEELTYREIAEILNISIKTVETQMGRALKQLRQALASFLK
ncbi:RNA polymerase sigma-70 factor [bacterium]|nr:RNA polymerase sigma-70 factor [bacterium]